MDNSERRTFGATLIGEVAPKTYQERKQAIVCTYPGCEVPPGDDSNECQLHQARSKARKRRHRQKARRRWAQQKLCLRCGRKRRPGSKWCNGCLIKAGKLRSPDQDKQRDKTSDRTWTDASGRERFHGQQSRGRQPVWQLDDQDLKYAIEAVDRSRVGLLDARSAAMDLQPKAQRIDALRAALSQAHLAQRHLEEVLDRNRYHQNQILTRRKVRR